MHVPAGASLRQLAADCAASVRRTFADHVPLYLCTVCFGLVTAALVTLYRLPFPLGSASFFLTTVGEGTMLVAAIIALTELARLYRTGRPSDPLSSILARVMSSALAGDRFGNMAHGLITFTPLMMIFVALKPDIARIRPFSWDKTFMHLGTDIGFGTPVWQILQPLLGHPPITAFLSMAYALWFPALFGCLFWQLGRPANDRTRSQYLLSFAFAWFFGGFVLATIFSSAGPCYYEHVVGGSNPYAPLLHYLRQTSRTWPVWTIPAQDALWQSYVTGSGDIEGISAMPSMHVMIATQMALLAWRTTRWLGIALTIFAFVILVGSIMLGWHYAMDGVAGGALGFVFWFVAGKVTQVWARDREQFFAKPVFAAPFLPKSDAA